MLDSKTDGLQLIDDVSTEQRILSAAEAEFLGKGYAAARTTTIAAAAGVTHAMLHYYYRTKDKLFSRVITDKVSELANTFVVTIDSDKPLDECLRAAIENHFEFVRANPALPRFMVREVFTNPELAELLRDRMSTVAGNAMSTLQRRIDHAVMAGECRPVSARTVIMDIISLNVLPIVALPMIERIGVTGDVDDVNAFLDARREENVQTILRKIRPEK